MRTSARPNAARQMTGLTMAGAAKLSRGRPACSLATRQASHCSKRRVGSRRAKPPPIADHCRAGCDDLDPLPRAGPNTAPNCHARVPRRARHALAETTQCAWRLAEALDFEALPGLNSAASFRAPRSCRIPGLSGTQRLRAGISPLPRRPESHSAETSSAWRAGITPAAAG